jgi:hypothetical protein
MRNFRGVMGQSVAAAATVETVQAGDGLSMVQAGVVVTGCLAHAGANYGARVGAQHLGVSNDTALLGVGLVAGLAASTAVHAVADWLGANTPQVQVQVTPPPVAAPAAPAPAAPAPAGAPPAA